MGGTEASLPIHRVDYVLGRVCEVGLAVARFLGFCDLLGRELESKSLDELLEEERFKKVLVGGLGGSVLRWLRVWGIAFGLYRWFVVLSV